jgi:hypothetical protein
VNVLRRFWDPYTPRAQTFAEYRPSVRIEFSPSTQETFTNVDKFRSLLPADYEIVTANPHNTVSGVFSSSSYQLIDFDFNCPGSGLNILLPPEKSN